MSHIEQQMTTGQLVALLDAALRTSHPLPFLDAVVMTFKSIGKHQDGTTAAWMGCLLAEGEIEVLMSLRAAWERGQHASPAEAAHGTARRHRMLDPLPVQHPEDQA